MLETLEERKGSLEEGLIDRKFGEITDKILEFLNKKGKVSVGELQEKFPLANMTILEFMSDWGLIELKNHEVKIAKFGLGLLNLE